MMPYAAFDPESYQSRAELRSAWIRFLGRWPWDWFATLTFYDAVDPRIADKRFRVWITLLAAIALSAPSLLTASNAS